MQELLRLQTAEYELSIWANQVANRQQVYQQTLANRVATIPAPEKLLFEPALVINDLDPASLISQAGNQLDSPLRVLTFDPPIFFENLEYQIEWIFYGHVEHAELQHRNLALSQNFRFTAQRNATPARLVGTLNTQNDVGWVHLSLRYGNPASLQTQKISLQVLPSKMLLDDDLPAMYQAIDQVFPLWRFNLAAKTEQQASRSQQRGNFPLMWLAHFSQLRGKLEAGLKVITQAPHSRLQSQVIFTKAARLKGKLSNRLSEAVKEDLANQNYQKRYPIEQKKLSIDTPENRFIKHVVSHTQKQLSALEQKLRLANQRQSYAQPTLSKHFLDELNSWQQPLNKALKQSFLREVSNYSGSSIESLVLQQKTGYSTVYRVWQELKFYLDSFAKQATISMRSVAEIYEIWCFLCIKQILEEQLGFQLVTQKISQLNQNDYFEYQLQDGFAGAFNFERKDGVTARLAHEPKFTKQGVDIRAYLTSQEPDIVLEVNFPNAHHDKQPQQFIWLFDAKYRIKSTTNRFAEQEDLQQVDYVPDDALNQMHRYRDALIRITKNSLEAKNSATPTIYKSRPTVGAFALYPGFFDQQQQENPYAEAIEEIGIGAFALLPSYNENEEKDQNQNGQQWLQNFLLEKIGNVTTSNYELANKQEQLYIQDAARIPYYGMQQKLYPDLTLTISVADQGSRAAEYFTAFTNGTAEFYHVPQATFLSAFKQHVVEEIRYLALATIPTNNAQTKQIAKIWPVQHVHLASRNSLTMQQAGKISSSTEPYYLFYLGKPLALQTIVSDVPYHSFRSSIKLTTLANLEKTTIFSDLVKVYQEALAK